MNKLTVIIPAYNEEGAIGKTLERLSGEDFHEIIVADGQSSDRTAEIARKHPVIITKSPANRARQMNEGARAARGDVLVFLHADCVPEEGALNAISEAAARGFSGGCLSQHIDAKGFIYRFIETTGNIRARLSRVFYGDQVIFARKDVFESAGGFDEVEMLEDIMFSKKLKKTGKTCVLNKKVYSSPRRWKKQGIARTTLVNYLITGGLFLGVSPARLKRIYHDIR